MSDPASKRGECDVAHSGARELRTLDGVVGEHDATEGDEQPRNPATDLAGADDAGCGAVQTTAEQTVEREVALSHALVGAMDVAIGGEDQGDRVLGDGARGSRRERVRRECRREPQRRRRRC